MSDYNYRRHNVNMMLYHLVCPTKFRKVVVDRKVDSLLKETCLHIQDRYDINFVQIGTDKNHVHFHAYQRLRCSIHQTRIDFPTWLFSVVEVDERFHELLCFLWFGLTVKEEMWE